MSYLFWQLESFFTPVKVFLFIQSEALRIDAVQTVKPCEANLCFVILGYINKIDMTQLDHIVFTLTVLFP